MERGRNRGRLTGSVFDPNDNPLDEAQVLVVEGPPHPDIAAITGPDGAFSLGSLPAGTYKVRAEKDGYHSATIRIALTSGRAAAIEFVLDRRSPVPAPQRETGSPFEAPEILE